MTETIQPAGAGPFALSAAQSFRIDVDVGRLTLVARVQAPDGLGQVSIGIPMTVAVAESLLAQLPIAVAEAYRLKREEA